MFSAKLERWLMLGLDMLRVAGGGDRGPTFAIELLKGAAAMGAGTGAGLGVVFAGVRVSSALWSAIAADEGGVKWGEVDGQADGVVCCGRGCHAHTRTLWILEQLGDDGSAMVVSGGDWWSR
jgi:hypothetical protein